MKFKFAIVSILCLFSIFLWSQNTQVSPYNLTWKGIEKWHIAASSVNVLSFQGAQYPSDDRLPYFNTRIAYNQQFKYSVNVINAIYIDLTSAENELLDITDKLDTIVHVETSILESRNNKYLDIHVLPFILKNGKTQKLISFDLQINTDSKPQKASTKAASLHQYADKSVLAEGKFIKIRLSQNGIYKLTYEDLQSMGINPANVRVFGYGGAILEQSFTIQKSDDLPELAIYMYKGTDGVFNSGDYILFYGQGINGWKYDSNRAMFSHTTNYYSQYGYYFVSSDAGIGKRIEEKSEIIPANATINTIDEFTDYKLYEKDLRNIIGGDNQNGSGKEFYGEIFNSSSIFNINFNFPNSVQSSNSVKAKLDVAASSFDLSNFDLSLNSEQLSTLYVGKRSASDMYEQAKGTNGIFNFTPNSDAYSFNLKYNKTTSTSVGYLNFLEVNARRKLIMSGIAMQFQNIDFLNSDTYNKYQLTNTDTKTEIWDITDPANISKISTQLDLVNNTLSFTAPAKELRTYIAINPTLPSAFSKPEILSAVPNQNLHALTPVDMIILTHPNFKEQAELLAQAHRDIDKLTVETVTTEQVYNEFSSGTPDATAYRWVMKMLYDKAKLANDTINNPKYLLLFGRGSFDNRKLLSNSGDNLILTYQAENSLVITLSYTTDDYFGLLDDNEGTTVPSNLIDIGIGRFPVKTTQEATDVVNKTINYMKNQDKGNWKNQICFLADDGDGALHMRQADSIAVSVARNNPEYQINKVYLDAFKQEVTASGESYPLVRNKLQNLLQSGLILLDYTGHAAPLAFSNEGIFTASDIKNLSNQHLPIFVGATCDFLQYDIKTVSGGEHIVLNPIGGGIGILSAARPVYASQNLTLNKLFCENLFKKQNGENQRIGDVLRYAKNKVGTEINKLSYIYMGDPALKLNYPTRYKVLTSKINENTSFGNDTLQALSVASIEGYIADDNGDTITNFNGKVTVDIYDKIQKITTLNNDKETNGSLTYFDRPNTLFSGEAVVKNGTFSFSVMLPKDIKYNYGTGRINYYAMDNENDYEAQGYFENFVIGGTNKNVQYETDGPEAKIYLNTENFNSGDKVNETPLFVADINDPNGINTVGSGIGHDVTITIDEDPMQFYVLNEYYHATENSYKSGIVQYKLAELSNGKHTLTFKVWDLLNNSSTKTIEFEVVQGLQPTIFSVSNYPNPVKSNTSIVVKHDRPETILYTTVEIFDLAGRKIWSFSQTSASNITWDLKGADGNQVKSGVYLYRVNIKTSNSDIFSKTNKMLVVEQ